MTSRWTSYEVEQLKSLFLNDTPDDIIAEKLNRTCAAVRLKRRKMKIVGDPNARRISKKSRKRMSDARKRISPEHHPSWKGGRRISHAGYVEIRMPKHHRARKNGYVFEHIIVAEKKLGRPVKLSEDVHHIDENKTNNHPDNLLVISHSEHTKLHPREKKGKILKCVVCESEFYRKPSHIKRAKCCSLRCVGKYTHLKKKGLIKVVK